MFEQVIQVGTYKVRLVKKIGEGGFAFVYLVNVVQCPSFSIHDAVRTLKKYVHAKYYQLLDSMISQTLDGLEFLEKVELHFHQILPKEFIQSLYIRKGSKLALKKLIAHTPDQLNSAQKEISAHTSVANPFVLSLIDSMVYTASNPSGPSSVYLLFPYYANNSMLDRIQQQHCTNVRISTFVESDCLAIMKGWIQGILALHEHSLRHGDIKPANLLLGSVSHNFKGKQTSESVLFPVIADLGSVTPLWEHPQSAHEATVLREKVEKESSAAFRCPELYSITQGAQITDKADVWALGCSFYCMIYGPYGPFESPIEGVQKLNIFAGKIRFPENPPVSDGLLTLMKSMLTVNENRRIGLEALLGEIGRLEMLNSSPSSQWSFGSFDQGFGSRNINTTTNDGSVSPTGIDSFFRFSPAKDHTKSGMEHAKCKRCGVSVPSTVDCIEAHSMTCISMISSAMHHHH